MSESEEKQHDEIGTETKDTNTEDALEKRPRTCSDSMKKIFTESDLSKDEH